MLWVGKREIHFRRACTLPHFRVTNCFPHAATLARSPLHVLKSRRRTSESHQPGKEPPSHKGTKNYFLFVSWCLGGSPVSDPQPATRFVLQLRLNLFRYRPAKAPTENAPDRGSCETRLMQ